MSEAADFEMLLQQALAPVEPPEHLSQRLEDTLQSITALAAEELESWELRAMRDPRNWARPALAAVVGTGAGAALVLLRARRRSAPRGLHGAGAAAGAAAGRALRDAQTQTRRLLRGR